MISLALWTALAETPITADNIPINFVGDGRQIEGSTLLEQKLLEALAPPSEVAVSNEGGASYSVALATPPAALKPSVSLAYSSDGPGHSWVSRGWVIRHGLPEVNRITGQAASRAYQDLVEPWRVTGGGYHGIIHKVAGDWVYSPTSGTSEARVSWTGNQLRLSRGGISTWLEPSSDALLHGTDPTNLLPVQQQDALGNAIRLTWDGSRLERIDYGSRCDDATPDCMPGTQSPDGPHWATVEFRYGSRPDVTSSARPGYLDIRFERLEVVTVRGNAKSTDYHFEYSDALARGPMLTRVWMSGGGVTEDLARMDYTDWDPFHEVGVPDTAPPRLRTTTSSRNNSNENVQVSNVRAELFDLTGDGYPEYYGNQYGTYFLQRPAGSSDPADFLFSPRDRWLPAGVEDPSTPLVGGEPVFRGQRQSSVSSIGRSG